MEMDGYSKYYAVVQDFKKKYGNNNTQQRGF